MNLSGAYDWNKVDTAKIKRSALRGVLALAAAIGTLLYAGVNTDSPIGGAIALAVAAFGPTVTKTVQRFVADNSQDPLLKSGLDSDPFR